MAFRAEKYSAGINMTLHYVSAQTRGGCNRALQIYRRTFFQATERRSQERFFGNIGGKRIRLNLKRGQADTVN